METMAQSTGTRRKLVGVASFRIQRGGATQDSDRNREAAICDEGSWELTGWMYRNRPGRGERDEMNGDC
jgi:hypothetical protein